MQRPRDQIISLPNHKLRQKSSACAINNHTLQLIENMKKAVIDWEESRNHEVGVALAAIQLNKPKSVVIIRDNYDNKDDKTFRIFINPEITKLEGKIEEDFEGCLSIKDIYGKVPRYSQARIKAQDLNGKTFKIKAEGFLSRVLQHEIDHTNGIVFIDHIKNTPEAFFKLTESGELEQLDYEKAIRNNHILW
ncbi:MAG: peptide deformylase [Candidatus Saccharimonadales bacterium]